MTQKHKLHSALGFVCLLLAACTAVWILQVRRSQLEFNREKRNEALFYAVMSNDPRAVRLLLAQGADVNVRVPAWHSAFSLSDLYEQVFAGRREASRQNPTALMNASVSGNHEMVSLLLDAGADVNARDSNGFTALHWTMDSSSPAVGAVIAQLIAHGADPNTTTKNGATAWQMAKQHPAILKALQKATRK